MIVDALLIIDFSHPWISTACHLYSSKVRSEMILSHWCPPIYSPEIVLSEKFDHTRIVSDTSFPILKCKQCIFLHQITDTDPPKFLEIFKSFRTIGFFVESLPK